MPRTDGAVCLYQGAPLFVHLDITRPGLAFSGAFARTIVTETGYLFPAMAAQRDAVLVAGQGHQLAGAFGMIVRPGADPLRLGPDRLGAAVNVNPVAVKADGEGWLVALVRDPRTIEILGVSLEGAVSTVGWRDIPATSQGITGWDGEALLMGDPPHRQIAGRSLSEATKVGSWWIGQDTHGERIVLVRATDGYAWQAFPSRTAQRPRFAILADGRFAITASDDRPVAEVLVLGAHDDAIGRPAAPPPQKPEEPKEPPVSVDHSAIERTIRDTAQDVDRAHPGLRARDLDAFTQRVASALAAKDRRYGRKARSRTAPISRSTIGYRYALGDGQSGAVPFAAVDYARDETGLPPSEWMKPGDQNHIRQPGIVHGDITDQYWIRVEPAVIGGGDDGDPGDEHQPPKIPALAVPLEQIRRAVDAIAAVPLPPAEIREVIKEVIVEREVQKPHPSYDDMMRLMNDTRLNTQAAHIVWRYLIEGYSHEELVREVRG